MQEDDRQRFSIYLLGCSEYYGKPVGKGVIELYWQGLQQYDMDAIEGAIQRHMQSPDTGQFMPKIADIVRMISGTSADAALIAWSKVDSAVRRVGPYASVVFDDPIIHRALEDMGGWIALGTKTDDEWPFVAKEFENRYRGYRSRGEIPAHRGKMLGIAEAENMKNGYAVPPPTLIGDPAKAQVVLEGGTDKPMIGISMLNKALLHIVETMEEKQRG